MLPAVPSDCPSESARWAALHASTPPFVGSDEPVPPTGPLGPVLEVGALLVDAVVLDVVGAVVDVLELDEEDEGDPLVVAGEEPLAPTVERVAAAPPQAPSARPAAPTAASARARRENRKRC